MICAWIETSSADTGSSQTTSSGFNASDSREADPLALTAGELVRVARRGVRRKADDLEQFADSRPDLAS